MYDLGPKVEPRGAAVAEEDDVMPKILVTCTVVGD